MSDSNDVRERSKAKTWRSVSEYLSDGEWALIRDLVPHHTGDGQIGRPPKWSKRAIVDGIFYATSTGCQWRSLPKCYPPWRTVYGYHLEWSRDGTWEKIADRLREMVRIAEGRDPAPSAGAIDARSVQGASTVGAATRGFDAGKKISGRKVFGLTDTIGLLVAVIVVAANVSDNAGGMAVMERAEGKHS